MKFKIGDIVKFETGGDLYRVDGYHSDGGYNFTFLGSNGREVPQVGGYSGEYMVKVDHQAPTNINAYLELFV